MEWLNNGEYITMPSGYPLDNMGLHRNWSIVNADVIDVNDMSDHNWLWAKLVYNGK